MCVCMCEHSICVYNFLTVRIFCVCAHGVYVCACIVFVYTSTLGVCVYAHVSMHVSPPLYLLSLSCIVR